MKIRDSLTAALLVSILAIGPALAQQGGGKGAKPGAKPAASASAAASATATPAETAAPAASAPASASPASSGSSGGATAAMPSVGPAIDGPTYSVRLRDLEQRVDELKEQIRRSHTRLSLLSDTVLSGGVQGSRADIVFQNELSSAFRVTRVLFVLDGAVQFNQADDTGALSDRPTIPIFSGSVPPGDHTLQVLVTLQGNGFGVFSYLRGYKFEVRSSRSFTATEGKTISVQAILYERGNATTAIEERPYIRFNEKVSTGLSGGPSAAQPEQPAAPAPASTGVSIGTGGK